MTVYILPSCFYSGCMHHMPSTSGAAILYQTMFMHGLCIQYVLVNKVALPNSQMYIRYCLLLTEIAYFSIPVCVSRFYNGLSFIKSEGHSKFHESNSDFFRGNKPIAISINLFEYLSC